MKHGFEFFECKTAAVFSTDYENGAAEIASRFIELFTHNMPTFVAVVDSKFLRSREIKKAAEQYGPLINVTDVSLSKAALRDSCFEKGHMSVIFPCNKLFTDLPELASLFNAGRNVPVSLVDEWLGDVSIQRDFYSCLNSISGKIAAPDPKFVCFTHDFEYAIGARRQAWPDRA